MTKISWTNATWNPTVGCSIVSPGCTNCYAMQMAHRIQRMNAGQTSHYDGTTKVVNGNAVWTGIVNLAPEHILLAPLTWKKPRRVFVNSMSDLFHKSLPLSTLSHIFAVMALTPHHTYQVLTKQSGPMQAVLTSPDFWAMVDSDGAALAQRLKRRDVLETWADLDFSEDCLPNVWLGVSAEDQTRANDRIPDLLATPAAVRFVSAEPLLGPIDFQNLSHTGGTYIDAVKGTIWTPGAGSANSYTTKCRKVDWIITGGESGPGHRPMQIEWAESIRKQCAHANTAFFFKQDSGPRAGMQGRASEGLWASKAYPEAA